MDTKEYVFIYFIKFIFTMNRKEWKNAIHHVNIIEYQREYVASYLVFPQKR